MKFAVVILALAMTGCATVEDIERSPATMSVMSGKSPREYTDCFLGKIADSRKPSLVETHHEGIRIVVPQKFSSDPAAILNIENRSQGSSIKVYERLSNMPLRPKDVQHAATACISG